MSCHIFRSISDSYNKNTVIHFRLMCFARVNSEMPRNALHVWTWSLWALISPGTNDYTHIALCKLGHYSSVAVTSLSGVKSEPTPLAVWRTGLSEPFFIISFPIWGPPLAINHSVYLSSCLLTLNQYNFILRLLIVTKNDGTDSTEEWIKIQRVSMEKIDLKSSSKYHTLFPVWPNTVNTTAADGLSTKKSSITLQCRHNECDGVSNHQPHDCLLSIYLDADQRKHQSSASLAFVRGIHRWPVNSPHKRPVTRKIFPIDDIIISCYGIYVFFWEFPNFLNISQSP